MPSRKSYFNKTIFKKNIFRFWPIWGFYAFYLMVCMPLSLYFSIMNQPTNEPLSAEMRIGYFADVLQAAAQPQAIFFMAAIAAMALFSYLYSARSCNMIHALPVDRAQLYVTNCFSGILFLAVPQILSFIVTAFVCMAVNVTDLKSLLSWLLMVLGMDLFALAMVVTVGMLTGQLVMVPVFFLLANILYPCMRTIIVSLVHEFTYGMSMSVGFEGGQSVLAPLLYLSSKVGFHVRDDLGSQVAVRGGQVVAGYALASLVFFLVGWLFYRAKQLESAGDLVSVKWLRPVFRWGVSLCIGMFVATIVVDSIWNVWLSRANMAKAVLLAVVLSAVSFFLAQMLLEKRFRVFSKKRVAECVAIQAILVVALLLISLDIPGYEKMIPEVADIQAAYLRMDIPIKMESKEELETMVAFHQDLLDAKEEILESQPVEGRDFYTEIRLRYFLKDGSELERSYTIPADPKTMADKDSLASRLVALENTGKAYLQYMFGDDYGNTRAISASVNMYVNPYTSENIGIPSEYVDPLFDAIMQDVEEGHLNASTRMGEDNYLNTIDLMCYNENGIANIDYQFWEFSDMEFGTSDGNSDADTVERYIDFNPECVHIIAVLEESGVLDEGSGLVTAEDLEQEE